MSGSAGSLAPMAAASAPSRGWAEERLERYEAPGVNTIQDGEAGPVWVEAEGATVVDREGRRYLDLTSGFGVATIGHRHPRVVEAVRSQAGLLLHGLGDVAAHPGRIELAERLHAVAPLGDAVAYFAISGSDAVEIALKTALLATGRPGILAFAGGYHGLTLGALATTSRPSFRRPFAAHIHPHVTRLPWAAPPETVAERLADSEAPIGAILFEPILGREGVVPPPAGWLAAIADAARARGALVIVDEIFTGFGKTGRWFAVEEEAVRPDLLCCGKAMGGGLPLAAVLGERATMRAWDRGGGEALHTATFLAHPLACAAALATLDVLREERLVERAARLGREILAPRLAALAARHDAAIETARGRGSLWGLALRGEASAGPLVAALRRRGVLALACGPRSSVLQIVPPATIDERDLERAVDAIDDAIAEAAP